MPAAIAARCRTARSACARCASTTAGACSCRGATSAACSAIRSRRSRSSTRYPGALAYSFGMLGCDLHCGYCQNWVTSQALRDPAAVAPPLDAHRRRRSSRDALRQRRARHGQHLQRAADHQRVGGGGLQGGARPRAWPPAYVSNGNGTPQVLEYLRPWVDLYKVDLKSFDDRHYRELGGRLAADPRHHPPAARDGLLGRDRHAADPGLQRLARRADAADRVRRRASRPTSRGT